MSRERISTAIFLVALTITLSAQEYGKRTVVLNGGSRLTGTILADSSDYLKLRITTPQVVTLKKSEVLFISQAGVIEKPPWDGRGYLIRISASWLAGHNNEGNARGMSFHLSNGYKFHNGISAGFGTGIEELDVTVIPVYADFRYHPLKARLSPFVWIKSGWSFTFGDLDDEKYIYSGSFPESRGGFMFNSGTGIELASWRRNAVNIGIGYRYQKITYQHSQDWYESVINEVVTCFNRIELQFGFIFR